LASPRGQGEICLSEKQLSMALLLTCFA